MPATKPEDADILLGEAVNAGDLEAAVALYDNNATFVPEPGKVVTGIDAVRQIMSDFINMKATITLHGVKAVQSGDTALLYSDWSFTGTDHDGNPVTGGGHGREVVKRQSDGTWKFVIDDPNGGSSG